MFSSANRSAAMCTGGVIVGRVTVVAVEAFMAGVFIRSGVLFGVLVPEFMVFPSWPSALLPQQYV